MQQDPFRRQMDEAQRQADQRRRIWDQQAKDRYVHKYGDGVDVGMVVMAVIVGVAMLIFFIAITP